MARTFALSFDRLGAPGQAAADATGALAASLLARAAGLAPGEPFPLSLPAADATDEAALAAALERLVGVGLLESAGPGRYRLHRLLGRVCSRGADVGGDGRGARRRWKPPRRLFSAGSGTVKRPARTPAGSSSICATWSIRPLADRR